MPKAVSIPKQGDKGILSGKISIFILERLGITFRGRLIPEQA
jgi:hypothetical protein